MSVASIDGVPFQHGLRKLGLAEAQHRINYGREKHKTALSAIRAALAGDSFTSLWNAEVQFLSDPDIKLTALIRANKSIAPGKRMTIEGCLTNAPKVQTFDKDDEPVYLLPKPKSGGYRPIQKFGPRKKAAQLLVADVMNLHFEPKPYQYTHKGLHAAIAAAKKHISSAQTRYVHLDVKNHFGSFDGTKLPNELPLPPEVVEHVVLSKDNSLAWDARYKATHKGLPLLPQHTPIGKSALLGLAQGSSCSPIVAAYCVSGLTWHPPPGVIAINYADNILLLGASKVLLAEAAGGLQAAFKSAPGGSFEMTLKGEGCAGGQIDFLGHALQHKGGRLSVWPSPKAEGLMFDKMDEIDSRLAHLAHNTSAHSIHLRAKALRLLARMYDLLRGWRAAYRECDDLDRYLAIFDQRFVHWVDVFGFTLEQIVSETTPEREVDLLDY